MKYQYMPAPMVMLTVMLMATLMGSANGALAKRKAAAPYTRKVRAFQEPDLPKACDGGADIVLAIDTSGSIEFNDPTGFKKMKEFSVGLVKKFTHPGNRFAIITFSTTTTMWLTLMHPQNRFSAINTLANLAYIKGETDIHAALKLIRDTILTNRYGERSEKENIVILITDGKQELPSQPGVVKDPAEMARILKREKSVIFITVGIARNPADIAYLYDISSSVDIFGKDSTQLAHAVKTFTQLEGLPNLIYDTTCRNRKENDGPCKDGYDILIMVDVSGSGDVCSSKNLRLFRALALNLVNKLNDSKNRFALMIYSSEYSLMVFLNARDNYNAMVNALRRLGFGRGRSKFLNALRGVPRAFSRHGGDRPNAPNILFILSPGEKDSRINRFDVEPRLQEAKNLKIDGINIFTVSARKSRLLKEMSMDHRHYIEVSNELSLGWKRFLYKIESMLCLEQR